MVEIKLHDLPMDKIGELAPPEDAMIKEMMDAGIIEKGYVLSDMSGAYIVINAEDERDATNISKRCRCFRICELSSSKFKIWFEQSDRAF